MSRRAKVSRKFLRIVQALSRHEVPDQVGIKTSTQVIPHQVFQTAEARHASPELVRSICQFRAHNRDLSFLVFDRPARDQYMASNWSHHEIFSVYKRARWGQLQADVFKYCVLWHRGGYWVDLGSAIDAQITALHSPTADAVFSFEDSIPTVAPDSHLEKKMLVPLGFVIPWALGVRPKHELIGRIIDQIVAFQPLFESRPSWSPQRAIFTLSGKGMLTREFRKFVEGDVPPDLEQVAVNWEGMGNPRIPGASSLLRSGSTYGKHRMVEIFSSERHGLNTWQQPASTSRPPSLKVLSGQETDGSKDDSAVVPLGDFLSEKPFSGEIPANLYQTSPTKTVHETHRDDINRFREMNPNLNHILFDDAAADQYMKSAWGSHPICGIYSRSQMGQMRADILRYCLIFERGGFYLDINKAVWTQLTDFLDSHTEGFVSFERQNSLVLPEASIASRISWPEKTVIQWCFGFAPQHRILQLAIDRIVSLERLFVGRVFGSTLEAVVSFTGPGVLTWALQEHLREMHDNTMVQVPPDFNGSAQTRLSMSHVAFGKTQHYGKRGGIPILAQE